MLVTGEFDRDPYWCRVWPSALALAELILQNPELVAGKSVCDVGAGLGLAGIAAALAGETRLNPPFTGCRSAQCGCSSLPLTCKSVQAHCTH